MASLPAREFLTALAGNDVSRAVLPVESNGTATCDVRHWVRNQLRVWDLREPGTFIDRVVLTVSELFTNAVLHARTRPLDESELVDVALLKSPIALGLRVSDNCCRMPPLTAVRPPAYAAHGRGLVLVDAEADAWTAVPRKDGGEDEAHGKDVWAFWLLGAAVLPQAV
ncbi:ATP-binding protein [Streptomyces sp. NPDC002476]|uniref:ATP-binding protein n=1 Tax=Streptomyces sp. NPDC002476 TaxID=3364648 RepID=UPI0036911451